MKIAIVGAGIGGLSTYLWLKKMLPPKEDYEITIFESHRSVNPFLEDLPVEIPDNSAQFSPHAADALGSVIVLSPNGLKVLKRLDEELLHDVTSEGAPLASYIFKTSHGYTLMKAPAGDRGSPKMTCVAVGRQALWQCLRRRVPDSAIKIRRVTEIKPAPGGYPHEVILSDASWEDEMDVVIGADGVNSVVRKAVLGEQEYRDFAPVYEGLVSVGGFFSTRYLPDDPKQDGAMHLVWGGAGYFGYGSSSTPLTEPSRHLPSKALPNGETAWWGSVYMVAERPDKRTLTPNDVREQLKEHHGNWTDSTVHYCIENAEIQGLYPISTLPTLPTWHQGRILLIGDAAHCLLPNSGQGACQALEDAEALTRLLSHYLTKASGAYQPNPSLTRDQAIEVAAKKFFKLRTPRIKMIADSSRMFDLNKRRSVFKEWMMYFIIWALGVFGKIFGRFFAKKNAMQELVGYDLPAAVDDIISEGLPRSEFDWVTEYHDDTDED